MTRLNIFKNVAVWFVLASHVWRPRVGSRRLASAARVIDKSQKERRLRCQALTIIITEPDPEATGAGSLIKQSIIKICQAANQIGRKERRKNTFG